MDQLITEALDVIHGRLRVAAETRRRARASVRSVDDLPDGMVAVVMGAAEADALGFKAPAITGAGGA